MEVNLCITIKLDTTFLTLQGAISVVKNLCQKNNTKMIKGVKTNILSKLMINQIKPTFVTSHRLRLGATMKICPQLMTLPQNIIINHQTLTSIAHKSVHLLLKISNSKHSRYTRL